jgi:hypothetical protein
MQSACAVSYCHLCPLWLYHIFSHYLINGMIFGKKSLKVKCVSICCTLKYSHYKKKSARYHKFTYVFKSSTRYSCQILTKLQYSRQTLEKSSDIKFHENSSIGSGVFHADGRTDRHEEANSRLYMQGNRTECE